MQINSYYRLTNIYIVSREYYNIELTSDLNVMLHLNWLICGYFAYVITSILWLCVGYFNCISILRLYEFHTSVSSVVLNHKASLYIMRDHESILCNKRYSIYYYSGKTYFSELVVECYHFAAFIPHENEPI